MATKKAATKPPAYTPPRPGADGRWLCNVVDGCDQTAGVQGVLRCGAGCALAGRQFDENLRRRRGELDDVDAREEAINVAATSRADEPQELKDILDAVELRVLAEQRKILGGEIEALAAERARVAADHTHPLFACDRHAGNLPA